MINLHVVLYLVFSVFILWKASLLMIEKKNIALFLPFFLVGIVLCFKAGLLFYLPQNPSLYAIVMTQLGLLAARIFLAIALIWLFIIFWRKNGHT
jgi:hypothetical protein